jgi:chaperone modulatory protein CbpM
MMTEMQVLAHFKRLEKPVLERWIAAGWVKPARSESGLLFDEVDVARTHLLCDLAYDMALGEDELGMVLSLIDRLHTTRLMLRAMSAAVERQPQDVRDAVTAHVRILLTEQK